jgi:DNA-binding MarR family transcriptional regulator
MAVSRGQDAGERQSRERPVEARAELRLFTVLETGALESQASLSNRVGAAVGLVNALLRRAVRKGYVKMTSAPARRYTYYLTPKGFSEKSRLVAEYLNSSLSFFREARGEYAALFAAAERDGLRRLVLIGAGELPEIAALAAMETNVTLVAVVDDSTNQRRIAGIDVMRSLFDVPHFDAVVIADARSPQATYDAVRSALPGVRVLCPSVLQIAPERWGSANSFQKPRVGE